jgi:acetate---CoA ligase (ADP-forming)
MADYPSRYESDIVLRRGSTLHVRPVRPDDAEGLANLRGRVSPESLRASLFAIPYGDGPQVAQLAAVDYDSDFALVGECAGRLDAVARYSRNRAASERAEAAVMIADAAQGQGIGTRLLEALAAIAGEHRIRMFDAYVPPDNWRTMDMLFDSGFEVAQRLVGGIIHVTLSLERTPAVEAKAAFRAQTAASASMKLFFEPKVVAVVGATSGQARIGGQIFHNLVTKGFTGRAIPVNLRAGCIDGIQAYAKVTDIPDTVDLAVIAVPARHVLGVVDDCIAKGVRALVVISAGFGEIGGGGREQEVVLVDKIRSAGIRMIGPNCMGILNTDPAVRLDTTFSPLPLLEGRVAFLTQSGALGLAILDYVQLLRLGISTFVSVGNKADVSANDLIQYWAEDARTDVILLYLESFGNPRKFSQIARRVGRNKPIVAVKAGRSSAGARAALSHTGSLAASDVVVDALFRQAGVIRTHTLEEMFDVATLLAHQPVPKGPRVAILTNAGGPGILAADMCEAQGLEVPTLSDATVAGLRRFLPQAASVANPVDMIATASPEHYRRSMQLLLADQRVDSLLVIYIPVTVTEPLEIAAAIVDGAASAGGKTVLVSYMHSQGAPLVLAPLPSYPFPESAASALAQAVGYGVWRQRPAGTPPHFDDIQPADARRIVDAALAGGGRWLSPVDAQDLLIAAGIGVARARVALSEADAVAAALSVGFPVALKAVGPDIVHKTDVGGVRLGIPDEDSVRIGVRELQAHVGTGLTGVLVQPMVSGGVEILIGGLQDPTFGPLMVCGSGGVLVDLIADSVFRLHPLTDVDAVEMVHTMKGAALLRGHRGAPPADEGALRETLLRVSVLMDLCPEIQELDINPIKVLETGVRVVDVRVRVAPSAIAARSRRVAY